MIVTSTFHLDHITPKKHRGSDDPNHLAVACDRCSLHRRDNLGGVDPVTGKVVRLFNPRGPVIFPLEQVQR